MRELNGALLINKPEGISSFGVIEELQKILRAQYGQDGRLKRSEMPKLGHGGTLDPFATGLLLVCVGNGVKLARYFLGSDKFYEGTIRFGETTLPGDATAEISGRTERLPKSIDELRDAAGAMCAQPYLQIPPMHSAKKRDGQPLYELARQGIEVERDPVECRLWEFEIKSYEKSADAKLAHARFSVRCTAGTYIRVLAQDLARLCGSLALLENLHRAGSGNFRAEEAWSLEQLREASVAGRHWDELPAWIPFDQMLASLDRAVASAEEARLLRQGQQTVLFSILKRAIRTSERAPTDLVAIYEGKLLLAMARREDSIWRLERVFA